MGLRAFEQSRNSMKLILISALAAGRVIGRENRLPFRLKTDLAHFKKLTVHQTLLVGRRTLESMGGPLPQRKHLVLTSRPPSSNPDSAEQVEWHGSLESAMERAVQLGLPKLLVIGGASVYAQTLPFAEEMILTHVDATLSGDVYFPEFSSDEFQHETLLRFAASADDEYAGEIVRYTRTLRT